MTETMLAAGNQPTEPTQTASAQEAPAVQPQAIPQQEPKAAGSEPAVQDPSNDADAAPTGAPEKYEFKTAEGTEFSPNVLNAYSEVAKELNLTQEAAQKVLDKVTPAMVQQSQERLKAVREEWANTARTDKEFGGQSLSQNIAVAKKALNAFGTPELSAFLEDSGLGNHPEIIRVLYRAGRAISDDSHVGGRQPASKPAPRSFEEHLANLYPSN
jgi:hypothetical protein